MLLLGYVFQDNLMDKKLAGFQNLLGLTAIKNNTIGLILTGVGIN